MKWLALVLTFSLIFSPIGFIFAECPTEEIKIETELFSEQGESLGEAELLIPAGDLPGGSNCPSKDILYTVPIYDKDGNPTGENATAVIKKGEFNDKYGPGGAPKKTIPPANNKTRWNV